MSLRPGVSTSKDTYSWDFTQSGAYTVKSGYWVAYNILKKNGEEARVLQPSFESLYQDVWKVDACRKIQHFLWRCISGCLAVDANLEYHHLSKDGSCNRCHSQAESVNHLLFQCPYARLIWALSPIPAPPGRDYGDSLFQNINRIMQLTLSAKESDPGLKVGPWLLWSLWKTRNDFLFKGIDYDGMSMVNKAMEDMEEWSRRIDDNQREQSLPPLARAEETWTLPPPHWYKCNVDGAWDASKEHYGIGWVLRNHCGEVCWMGLRKIPKLRSPIEVETEALRWAMRSMKQLNFENVIFVSDSKCLVGVLNEIALRPNLHTYVQDIKHIQKGMANSKVTFQCRETNRVADKIAKEAISLEISVPRLYTVLPFWLKSYVEDDLIRV